MLLSQRWALSTSAVLSRLNRANFYQLGGGAPNRPGDVETARSILSSWWGVEDPRGLAEIVAWLGEQGHSAGYDDCARLVDAHRGQIPPGLDDEVRPQVQLVAQIRGEVGPRSLTAWDAGRLVAIVGWGHLAGMLSEHEAWVHAMGAAVVLQRAYTSWAELRHHYMIGRAFWGGGNEASTRAACDWLGQDDSSPHVCIPWATPLGVPGVEPHIPTRWRRVFDAYAERPPRPPSPPSTDHPPYAPPTRLVRVADGAELVHDGEKLEWRDHYETAIERDQWPDDWGPLSPPTWDYDTPRRVLGLYTLHEMEFRRLAQRDAEAAERRLLEHGYRSVGQYFRVHHTIAKHFGTPGGHWLAICALDDADCNQAILDAHAVLAERDYQDAIASDPSLTAPIDGLTMEGLAYLSAHQSCGTQGAAWTELLARHGLDEGRFAAASVAWGERLRSGAAEGRIAQAYAAMYTAQVQSVRAEKLASGDAPPPIAFERYCEIIGAMAAWGQLGLDMNVEIERVFGMTMQQFTTASLEAASSLSTDYDRMVRYMALVAKYTVQYGGAVDSPSDEDEDDDSPSDEDDEDEDDDDDD